MKSFIFLFLIIFLAAFNICKCDFVCPAIENVPCRNNSNACDSICTNGTCEIRVVVILPNSTDLIATLPEVMNILNNARENIISNGILPPFVKIEFDTWDDKCDPSYAQIATVDAYAEGKCIHLILGPICDYCLATVSRIVKYLGAPLLTSGGFSKDFEKPKTSCADEYFMLMRTGTMFYMGVARFLHLLLKEYGWKKLLFLYDKNGQYEVAGLNTCSLVMQAIVEEVKQMKGFEYEDGDMGLSSLSVEDFLKSKIGVDFGITVMCTSTEKRNAILLAAEKLGGMVYNGEYLYINIDLTNSVQNPAQPWLNYSNNSEINTRLENAYKSVITLTGETVENQNENIIKSKSHITSGFYDALLLYAHAVSPFIDNRSASANNDTKINVFDVINEMWGKTFTGLEGKVEMNCNGDRINTYSLLSLNHETRRFEVVANYVNNDTNFVFVEGRTVHWVNGKPPLDVPTCGYDNSKCLDESLPTYILIIIIVSVLVVFGLVAAIIFFYRRAKFEAAISSMAWKVDSKEIENIAEIGRNFGSTWGLNLRTRSQQTLNSEYSESGQRYITTGYYKKIIVAIKRLPHITKDIQLRRSDLLELKQMKDLSHDHLVKFYGACLNPSDSFLLTEYCSKGSLQDLLENEQFKMDKMITLSLMQDIVRGMIYLHNSEIRFHGSLTSSNCVVDSRLTVKITDFGLHFLRDHLVDTKSHSYWKKQLWTAPEILRKKTEINKDRTVPYGTQKGDVYSFGIIMHEIIMRKGPFYLGEEELDPKDIVEKLPHTWENNPLRPYIDLTAISYFEEVALVEIRDLMTQCWHENDFERPHFDEIKRRIWKLNAVNEKGNILDNLLSRMEQYANTLEHLVDERTHQYLMEKEKCEEVLYQLLPKSVASQLINGNSVKAETFDQVTVYFSDIVGFTQMSANSTPMQVVTMLNDLYTLFDEIIEKHHVYKVETIGDAYMVVSGLPERNDDRHASEIACMSLELLAGVRSFKISHRPNDKLLLRIGIHSGPCVAGVVGQKMPRYCLFGDTVNTASRMESTGEALKIHVSPDTKILLDKCGLFHIELRGPVNMKGKGTVITYWLKGKKNMT